jgi:hypothetical protein
LDTITIRFGIIIPRIALSLGFIPVPDGYSFTMPAVWQRHPRYFLLVALVLTATFLILNPYQPPPPTDSYAAYIRDSTLPARIERAERVYQKVIADRKELIQKYGPTSRDIVMYV